MIKLKIDELAYDVCEVELKIRNNELRFRTTDRTVNTALWALNDEISSVVKENNQLKREKENLINWLNERIQFYDLIGDTESGSSYKSVLKAMESGKYE